MCLIYSVLWKLERENKALYSLLRLFNMGLLKINHKIGPVEKDLDIIYHSENLLYFRFILIMIQL